MIFTLQYAAILITFLIVEFILVIVIYGFSDSMVRLCTFTEVYKESKINLVQFFKKYFIFIKRHIFLISYD